MYKATLKIKNPTGNVSFNINAYQEFTINEPTLNNCSAAETYPTKILAGHQVSLTFTAADGYKFTSSAITGLSGATQVSWTVSTTSSTDDTGTLVISNPTSNISFTVSGKLL